MSYKAHEEYFRIDGFDEGIKIEIVDDDNPINPREEYDNVGTIGSTFSLEGCPPPGPP